MPKCQPSLKAEKRQTIAQKRLIKQKKGATLAGQMIRFKTVGKYQDGKINPKS